MSVKKLKGMKKAVFIFGRFQPPQLGHKKIIDRAVEEGKKQNADVFIFPSQTTDNTKDPLKNRNPLDWKTKIDFLTRFFPEATVITASEVKSPWDVLDYLENKNYTDITIVAGSDRFDEYSIRLSQYALKMFNTFQAINGGIRDPDNNEISGMSATTARLAAIEGNLQKFKKATRWNEEDSRHLMLAIRKGMGID